MITLKDRVGKAAAIVERQGAQRRLSVLSQRLQDLDHDQTLERIDCRVAMRAVFDLMARCDEILAPLPDPVLPPLPSAASEDRAMRHHRMQSLLSLLDGLPPSCVETARAMRRALLRELRGPSAARVSASIDRPRRARS